VAQAVLTNSLHPEYGVVAVPFGYVQNSVE